MTPEEKARIKIDQWFADAGWKVVNREDYEPTGPLKIKFSGFSWEYVYTHYYLIPKNLVYYQVRLLSRICLG